MHNCVLVSSISVLQVFYEKCMKNLRSTKLSTTNAVVSSGTQSKSHNRETAILLVLLKWLRQWPSTFGYYIAQDKKQVIWNEPKHD